MFSRSGVAAILALGTPAVLTAQAAADGGRGALRPFVHVLLAYGVAWILVLIWVWWIARSLKRVNNEFHGPSGRKAQPRPGDMTR